MLLLLLAFNFPLNFNLEMALPNEDISTSTKVLIMCLGNIMLCLPDEGGVIRKICFLRFPVW